MDRKRLRNYVKPSLQVRPIVTNHNTSWNQSLKETNSDDFRISMHKKTGTSLYNNRIPRSKNVISVIIISRLH